MALHKLPLGRQAFAQGLVEYVDRFPAQKQNRSYIVVPVRFGHSLPTWAILDTGAEYCIMDPEDAKDKNIAYTGKSRRLIGGGDYEGRHGSIAISIDADEGEGVTIADAHVWVPTLYPGQQWSHPNILGLAGFLQKVRFAVDPEDNTFYFGALGAES